MQLGVTAVWSTQTLSMREEEGGGGREHQAAEYRSREGSTESNEQQPERNCERRSSALVVLQWSCGLSHAQSRVVRRCVLLCLTIMHVSHHTVAGRSSQNAQNGSGGAEAEKAAGVAAADESDMAEGDKGELSQLRRPHTTTVAGRLRA